MENWFSHLAKAPKIDLVKHTTVEPLTILAYDRASLAVGLLAIAPKILNIDPPN